MVYRKSENFLRYVHMLTFSQNTFKKRLNQINAGKKLKFFGSLKPFLQKRFQGKLFAILKPDIIK